MRPLRDADGAARVQGRLGHRDDERDPEGGAAEPDLPGAKIPSELDRLVRHCLEKNPAERFQSARDLAFDLEALAGSSRGRPRPSRRRRPPPVGAGRRRRRRRRRASWRLRRRARGQERGVAAVPSFAQLTFRQEPIFNARLAPDGKTVVYSAAPSGNTPEIFSLRSDYPGASPRSLRPGQLLSISSRGELAVLIRARYRAHSLFEGTLARMPLEGGAPREVLDGVREAEWSPDGADLAVIRDVGGKDRLEFPAGKVLCETGGYFSELRFSPRGDRIAFFEHPFRYDDRGEVALVDLAGKKTVLSGATGARKGSPGRRRATRSCSRPGTPTTTSVSTRWTSRAGAGSPSRAPVA